MNVETIGSLQVTGFLSCKLFDKSVFCVAPDKGLVGLGAPATGVVGLGGGLGCAISDGLGCAISDVLGCVMGDVLVVAAKL
jgi:hypothetical protein